VKTTVWILLAALGLAAQPKRLSDAQVQTRAVSGGLEKQLQSLAAAQPQPAWAGYVVPASRSRNFGCNSYWRDNEFAVAGGVVHLEPPREVMVLFRFHNNEVSQVRTLAPDCEMSANGAPFYWLTGVQADGSVAALSSLVRKEGLAGAAIHAIGMHAGAVADGALEKLLAADQPVKVRRDAVRSLGRRGGDRALAAINRAISNDGDRDVRRAAVSALRSLPDGSGIPVLIQIAKSHRDYEVRKQAMSVLGQTRDPRASAYFEDVLRR